MDIIIAIGGKIGEYLVAPVGKQFSYLIFYHRNVNNLNTQVDELHNIHNGLQPKIEAAQNNGENITDDVQGWLNKENEAHKEAKAFYEDEYEVKKRRCWNKSRYSVSRRAKKMTEGVVALQQIGRELSRGTIAHPPPPGRPDLPSTGESSGIGESNTALLNEVLQTLKDDSSTMIGIYGMDGVGMTRLMKNVKRRANNQFREIAMATVSKEVNIRNVQGEIADELGLKFTEETLTGRASRLYRRLVSDGKKKLILLEDVCEELNLEAIGIPFGGGEENKHCKIIMTSPSRRVGIRMNTQKNFKMETQKEISSNETLGPYGGQGGSPWDDQTHTTIRSITIEYDDWVICSLRIEYDDNGHLSDGSLYHHGASCKTGHGKTEKIQLRFPDEFLISVSGYYSEGANYVYIQSLKFESNQRTFDSIGEERGQYFSSPSNVGKIVGFHGRSGWYIDAIGPHYEPICSPDEYEFTESYGGKGGYAWDDGGFTTIRKLQILYDTFIDSILIEYDNNGCSKWSDIHGSSVSKGQSQMVELDYPGEFLISISGYITQEYESGNEVIRSLKIESNKNVYGSFGEEKGTPFSFSSMNGKIIGFYGRSGAHLYSLGVNIAPFPAPKPTTSMGPFGGNGGSAWDDGTYSTVRQLKIWIGGTWATEEQLKIWTFPDVINAISIEYDNNGRSAGFSDRGIRDGEPTTIKLDYPGEFLISMSGSYNIWGGRQIVNSLTFESNRRTHGPFGEVVSENSFSLSPLTKSKIVGFHGRCGICLDSIGAHFQPF